MVFTRTWFIALNLLIASVLIADGATIDFDGMPSDVQVTTIDGVAFSSNVSGYDLKTTNRFETSSAPNSLGVDDGGLEVFLPGDAITLTFPYPVVSISVKFISSPLTPANAYSITTNVGSSQSGVTPENILSDGSEIYTVNFNSNVPFTQATLETNFEEIYSFNIDDISISPAVTLDVNIVGQGSVYIDLGNGTICSDNCVQSYIEGITVPLYVNSSGNGYNFAGWSGDCTGTGDCFVTMNTSKNVTATFLEIVPNPVILEGSPGSFTTIQFVYDGLTSGQFATIKVKAGLQASENLTFDRDVTLRLEGGYDHIFTNIIGDTSFYGTLTIKDGSATISDLIIK